MKRIISIFLCIALLFSGCTITEIKPQESQVEDVNEEAPSDNEVQNSVADDVISVLPIESTELNYSGLDDSVLLRQVEDLVYSETVKSLNSSDYVVESVQAAYVSKEYIDELMFNSQSNVYFGFTIDELNNIFQGTRYVFTLSEDGQTTVKELEVIEDKTTETIIKNVAIGAGVILICVVVTVATEGAGAPAAISAIFAASAKTGAIVAGSSAAIGGIGAGVVRGIETGDMDEALKAGALAGSEGFKLGAISGTIYGGGKEALVLNAATKSGLTMSEAAIIQKESQLPMDVISQLHSMEEYEVYKSAGLKPLMVNGKMALIQDIDLDFVSELPDGTKVTNLARMQSGYAPIDPATGKYYQLHHIGQNVDGTLAVLTEEQHLGNSAILNIAGKESEINRPAFAKIRKEFWTYLGNLIASGGAG